LNIVERSIVAWFGPRGFASVFFGLLVLNSGIARGEFIFHLAALVITGSMILHSSLDAPVARFFFAKEPQQRRRAG
jgi:NhaP-type Na+/H+ or K+/H+ antiporter